MHNLNPRKRRKNCSKGCLYCIFLSLSDEGFRPSHPPPCHRENDKIHNLYPCIGLNFYLDVRTPFIVQNPLIQSNVAQASTLRQQNSLNNILQDQMYKLISFSTNRRNRSVQLWNNQTKSATQAKFQFAFFFLCLDLSKFELSAPSRGTMQSPEVKKLSDISLLLVYV